MGGQRRPLSGQSTTRPGRAQVWRAPQGGGRSQQITLNGGICGFESPRGVPYYRRGESGARGSLFRQTTEGEQPVSLLTQGVPCRTAQSPKGFYFMSADTSDVYLCDEAGKGIRESCSALYVVHCFA